MENQLKRIKLKRRSTKALINIVNSQPTSKVGILAMKIVSHRNKTNKNPASFKINSEEL